MADIDLPLLVISGGADVKLPTGFLHDEFVRYFPSANFTEVQGAGHLLPVESPETVAKLLRETIKGGYNKSNEATLPPISF